MISAALAAAESPAAPLTSIGRPSLVRRGRSAEQNGNHHGGACARTADLALVACGKDVAASFKLAIATCINLTDREARDRCMHEARATRRDDTDTCGDQHASRLHVCNLVGPGPYDPDFAPGSFAPDPGGNRFAPLAPGYEWTYQGEGQTDTVRVASDGGEFFTKDINGVTCIVVSDVVKDAGSGDTVEDTEDWFVKHRDTDDIWYCGELARDFETFEGDVPALPELQSVEGSFKAGRDHDKAGILIEQNPQVGDAYRQEFSPGNAEDIAVVLSTSYVFDGPTDQRDDLNFLVPADLAGALCSDPAPCLVTKEFSPLEPDVVERKYYAPGIGVFLEVDLSTDGITELVSCNFDSRCPTP